MDFSSVGTETRRFIDAVFREAGEWLEPEYWVLPGCDDAHSQHVIFISKLPYAHHAEKAYQAIQDIKTRAQVSFQIWTLGNEKPVVKEEMIAAAKRYGSVQQSFQSFSGRKQKSVQTEHDRIILEWLNLAGETEKLSVQQSDTRITVRCGDSLQAARLSHRLDWLVKTGLEFVEIHIGDQVFNNIALERIAKDDRHRFIYSLLETHQQILEEIGVAIDDDKVRLYCRSKEEAIALHDGRWDLVERAQEQQLPQKFELYYSGDDHKPQLFKTFSIREGLLAKRLQRREIAALFQDFNNEGEGNDQKKAI
ncbi:MAG: hypothetical protein ACAF41_11920 [Leptolyngbya sp. BL-A-14]